MTCFLSKHIARDELYGDLSGLRFANSLSRVYRRVFVFRQAAPQSQCIVLLTLTLEVMLLQALPRTSPALQPSPFPIASAAASEPSYISNLLQMSAAMLAREGPPVDFLTLAPFRLPFSFAPPPLRFAPLPSPSRRVVFFLDRASSCGLRGLNSYPG